MLARRGRASRLAVRRVPRLHPDHQRQGIGTRRTELFLAEARGKGISVRLNVLRGNPARELYERLGFVEIGGDDERHYLEHPASSAGEEPG